MADLPDVDIAGLAGILRAGRWAATTMSDGHGHEPTTNEAWCVIDADEDDPPIAGDMLMEEAQMVADALNALPHLFDQARNPVCPHVVTDGSTSHCSLAEEQTRALEVEVGRLEHRLDEFVSTAIARHETLYCPACGVPRLWGENDRREDPVGEVAYRSMAPDDVDLYDHWPGTGMGLACPRCGVEAAPVTADMFVDRHAECWRPAPTRDLVVGERVKHVTLGTGVVVYVEYEHWAGLMYQVKFDDGGGSVWCAPVDLTEDRA